MSEQTPAPALPITTQTPEGYTITFESREDVCVYAAHFGTYPVFLGIYRQVYQTEAGAPASYQRQLRLKRNALTRALQRSQVSNGQTLYDYLKARAGQ